MNSWLVKQKQIKRGFDGLVRHSNYLMDEKRPSHKGSAITCLTGSADAIARAHELRAKNRQNEGLRGGGITNKATSFVLSLPPEIRPSHTQWKKILASVCTALARTIGVDKRELLSHSLAVLHEREGGNPHIHLLCSNVISGGFHKDLSKYTALNAVKMSFNLAVKKELGVDWRKYKPENPNCGDVPLHIARVNKAIEVSKQANIDTLKANQANDELRLVKNDLKVLKRFNTNYGRELQKWFESKDEKTALKSEAKLQKMHNKIKTRFSENVLNNLGHYGATEAAEKKKKRKIGLKI